MNIVPVGKKGQVAVLSLGIGYYGTSYMVPTWYMELARLPSRPILR